MGNHWYNEKGEACHTQLCKPGAKNPTRATSITDARKLGLFPSVTTVLKIRHNQALVDWMVRVSIQAALTAYRRPGEEDWKFHRRIAYEGMAKGRTSADFGDAAHYALEQWNLDHNWIFPVSPPKKFKITPEQWEIIRIHLCRWQEYSAVNHISILAAERRTACRVLGLAGTVDLISERKDEGLSLEDFKSQDVKPNKKGGPKEASFYPSFGWQLALYARMVRIVDGLSEDPAIVSHVLDSNGEVPLTTRVFTREEQTKALQMGLTLAKAWFLENDYFPEGIEMEQLHWMGEL